MAAVGASAVGVERPRERHPGNAVERAAAVDLLIAGGVRAAHRLGERLGASLPYPQRDVACGWRLKIFEERRRFERWRVNLRHMFAIVSTRCRTRSRQ